MACTFPYIENQYRESNPEIADTLNNFGIATWRKIKDSNLFEKKEDGYYFGKKGTKKRLTQDKLVSNLNNDYGVEIIKEEEGKVSVNVLGIGDKLLSDKLSKDEEKTSFVIGGDEKFTTKSGNKVVDEKTGNPIEVFHGTNESFESFNTDKLGSKNFMAESAAEGFFFAGDKKTSEAYIGINSGDVMGLNIQGSKHLEDVNNKFRKEQDVIDAQKQKIQSEEKASSDEQFDKVYQILYGKVTEEQKQRLKYRDNEWVKWQDRAAKRMEEDGLVEKQKELNQKKLDDLEKLHFKDKRLSRRIVSAHLYMNNPYVFDFNGEEGTTESLTSHIKKAKKAGHDGVIFKNLADGGEKDTIYVVFNPEQIKIINKNILEQSLKESPQTPNETLSQEWKQYESEIDTPSLYLSAKFQGFSSLKEYQQVTDGNHPTEFTKYAESKLNALLKDFTETIGVGIKDIAEFQQTHFERTGRFISASGVADLINKTIYVANGNIDALTEEVSHFIVAMLPKEHPLFIAIDSYLENTPEYVIYYDDYLKVYKGDVRKTRDEIIGKIIKNVLQEKTEKPPLSLKSLVNAILEYIGKIFGDKTIEYYQATASIKQMFFAQSLVESLGELDTSNKELFQLSYDILGNTSNFKSSNPETIIKRGLDNIFTNTREAVLDFKEKAAISGNQASLITASKILKKIDSAKRNNISPDEALVDITNIIASSLNGLNKSFNELKSDNYAKIKTLFAEGGEFSKEEMAKLSYTEYKNRLQQIGKYISYIQDLKDFGNTLKSLKTIIGSVEANSDEFIETVSLLDPNLADNAYLQQAFGLMKDEAVGKVITDIDTIYDITTRDLLKGLLEATTTEDQRAFMKAGGLPLLPLTDMQTEQVDGLKKEANKDRLSWAKSLLKGSFMKTAEKGLMPISMQSDVFIQNINAFVNSVRRYGQENGFKVKEEAREIQDRLIKNGVKDQEWISAKNDKGQLSFKLLTRYNYDIYAKSVFEHLKEKISKNLIGNSNITNQELVQSLLGDEVETSMDIFAKVANAFTKEEITDDEFKHIYNYLDAERNYYNLQRIIPNKNLSTTARIDLENYISDAKKSYGDALSNPSYDWGNDRVQDAINSQIDMFALQTAILEKIEQKRALLEAKYYTFPPDTDTKMNPVFRNEKRRVEGLLGLYKKNLGYYEDEDGNILPSEVNTSILGDEYLFELSGVNPDQTEANYVDKEYQEIEKSANDIDDKKHLASKAKMDALNYQMKFNKEHNEAVNFMPYVPKRPSEYNKLNIFGNRIRVWDIVTKAALPTALALYVTPSFLMGGDFSFVGHLDYLMNMPWVGQVSVAVVNLSIAQTILRFFNIFTENMSREINSPKDILKIFNALFKTFGMQFSALKTDFFHDEDKVIKGFGNKGVSNKDKVKGFTELLTRFCTRIANYFAGLKYKGKGLTKMPFVLPKSNTIPRLYEQPIPAAVRSTQFLDNFIQYASATYDYETKVDFEGALKAIDAMEKKRYKVSGLFPDWVENVYLNRMWYGKIYPENRIMNGINVLVGIVARKFLMGGALNGIKNLSYGVNNILIKSGPLLTGQAGIDALKYTFGMMFNAITDDRMAVESNFIKQVKYRITAEYQSGIPETDTGQSVAANVFKLSNAQMLNAWGESFISTMIVAIMLRTHKLVDDEGNRYDLAKWGEFKEGKLVLKEDAPKAHFDFITEEQANKLSPSDLSAYKPNNLRDKGNLLNRSLMSEGVRKILETPELELNKYLNTTFLSKVDYFREKTQGVYHSTGKARLATTTYGKLMLMFSNHLASAYKTSLSRKAYNTSIAENEQGFITTTLSTISDVVGSIAVLPFSKFIEKYGDPYIKQYQEENKEQLKTLEQFYKINEWGLIKDLGVMSGVLSTDWAVKEMEQLAEDVFEGRVAPEINKNKKFSKDEIFKTLYFSYLTQKNANAYKAKNLGTMSLVLGTSAILYFGARAMKSAAGDDDKQSVWEQLLEFSAALMHTMLTENFINYAGIGVAQKMGLNVPKVLNQKVYGYGAKETNLIDVSQTMVVSGTLTDIYHDITWSISALAYNIFNTEDLIFYDEKQSKILLDLVGNEPLPLSRHQYIIKTTHYGAKHKKTRSKLIGDPINVSWENFADMVLTPGFRDAYKLNKLKTDYYKKLPTTGLEMSTLKMQNGYYKQTGRNLFEDLRDDDIKIKNYYEGEKEGVAPSNP